MLSKREPLVVRTAIVAAITAVLHVLVVLSVLPIDSAQETAIGGAVDLIGTAVAVVWSRQAVTPVASSEGVIQGVPEEQTTNAGMDNTAL